MHTSLSGFCGSTGTYAYTAYICIYMHESLFGMILHIFAYMVYLCIFCIFVNILYILHILLCIPNMQKHTVHAKHTVYAKTKLYAKTCKICKKSYIKSRHSPCSLAGEGEYLNSEAPSSIPDADFPPLL